MHRPLDVVRKVTILSDTQGVEGANGHKGHAGTTKDEIRRWKRLMRDCSAAVA